MPGDTHHWYMLISMIIYLEYLDDTLLNSKDVLWCQKSAKLKK